MNIDLLLKNLELDDNDEEIWYFISKYNVSLV